MMKKISSLNTKRTRSDSFATFLLIGLVEIITHGTRIAQFGYYRDDWYFLWAGNTQGLETIRQLFAFDRPFVGIVYAFDYLLLGDMPIKWQFYALGIHFIGALALLWILRALWPKQTIPTTAITLFYIVYPGFLQLPNANTYQNQLLTYTVAILSIAFSVQAILSHKRLKIILCSFVALVLALFYFFMYEYMIGLEILRFVLMWMAYTKGETNLSSWKNKILSFGMYWAIYVPPIIIYTYWRVFVFESGRKAMNVSTILAEYRSAPFHMVLRLFVETLKDFFETVVLAWGAPIYRLLANASYADLKVASVWTLIAIALVGLYAYYVMQKASLHTTEDNNRNMGKQFLLIGLLVTFSALIPHIVVGRDVHFSSGYDRYTLQATIGVGFLWTGFLLYAVRMLPRNILFLIIFGIAVLTHQLNGIFFQNFWAYQQQLWWQLSWRAPDIEQRSVLIVVLPEGYRLFEGYEIWAPANIIYAPDVEGLKFYGQVLNANTVDKLMLGQKDERVERDVVYIRRNYKRAIILSLPNATACLHVIDGQKIELDQDEVPWVKLAAPYSRNDLILSDAPIHRPNPAIFGPEPEHGWCYFYQKATLARQRGDWNEVALLGDEAFTLGLAANDYSELIPFMEGYAASGDLDKATALADEIRQYLPLQSATCSQLLENHPDHLPNYPYEIVMEILCSD